MFCKFSLILGQCFSSFSFSSIIYRDASDAKTRNEVCLSVGRWLSPSTEPYLVRRQGSYLPHATLDLTSSPLLHPSLLHAMFGARRERKRGRGKAPFLSLSLWCLKTRKIIGKGERCRKSSFHHDGPPGPPRPHRQVRPAEPEYRRAIDLPHNPYLATPAFLLPLSFPLLLSGEEVKRRAGQRFHVLSCSLTRL